MRIARDFLSSHAQSIAGENPGEEKPGHSRLFKSVLFVGRKHLRHTFLRNHLKKRVTSKVNRALKGERKENCTNQSSVSFLTKKSQRSQKETRNYSSVYWSFIIVKKTTLIKDHWRAPVSKSCMTERTIFGEITNRIGYDDVIARYLINCKIQKTIWNGCLLECLFFWNLFVY